MTMMGVIFLLFAVAPAYWAFYNFGLYGQKAAFVGELQTSSEQFLTPRRTKRQDFLQLFDGESLSSRNVSQHGGQFRAVLHRAFAV